MAVAVLPQPVVIPPKSQKHLLPLDGIRGLAILMVFFYHYGAGGIESSSRVVRLFAQVCNFGWSGVDLFFVLSGFLITGILYDTQYKPGYYKKFYARRTLRIFPIYYLFIGICLVIVPFALWRPAHLWFLVYLGYPAALIFPLDQIPVRITHLWSLSIEEQFYFVWPWVVKKLRTQARIVWAGAVLMAFALALRFVLPRSWGYLFILCRMDGLALGAMLAMFKRAEVKLPGWQMFAVGASGLGILVALRHSADRNDYWMGTFGFSLTVLMYGGLLVLSLGPLAKWFSNSALRIFGKYSYGLYLYHLPLTTLLMRMKPIFGRVPGGLGVYVLACLVINLGVAAVSFHLIEQPVLRLKDRFAY